MEGGVFVWGSEYFGDRAKFRKEILVGKRVRCMEFIFLFENYVKVYLIFFYVIMF